MASCLIVVDVQQGFINEHTEHIPQKVEQLQHEYDVVIITRFINKQNSPFRKFLNWHEMSENDPATELAFVPKSDAIIVEKHGYSCLIKPVLEILQQNSIEEVHICGIDTDACILKCAMDLFDLGIRVVVLSDCCASSGGRMYHKHAVEILKRNIADVR